MGNAEPQDLVKVLRGEEELVPLGSPEEAAMAIVNRILEAPDIESVLSMPNALTADDIVDQPWTLRHVEFRKSDFDEGSPVYALITAKMAEDGGDRVITCGGQNVIAQLIRFSQIGFPEFPIKLIKKDKPTSNGFYPVWLTKA